MRFICLAFVALMVGTPAMAQDADRSAEDGGVMVDGWKARIDRRPISQGKSVTDSKFGMEGDDFRLSIGPSGEFWNDANVASGDYEVKATFQEHAMRDAHPHPYGIFIGGSDLDSDTEMLLYCIVYANGDFVIKTFHGANVTTLVPRGPHDAVNKSDASGEASNEIGWRVRGGTASCVVNGTEVASLQQADVVGADKIESLDGVYGIRVGGEIELTVSGFGMTQN
ncbi:MAG: hypothetical protein BMS9Abin29_2016 [Gemmatimonadota bacterium]|nr:MAG: hypothetical protein BMS9Abin29_2016 [Gemmatimonadota bacterium]